MFAEDLDILMEPAFNYRSRIDTRTLGGAGCIVISAGQSVLRNRKYAESAEQDY